MLRSMPLIVLFVVAVSTFIGYSLTRADESFSEQDIELTSIEQSIKQNSTYQNKTNERYADIKSYEVKVSEYTSFETFIQTIHNYWKPNSEYRSNFSDKESAESTLANATLHYVNFFEKEISERGMTTEFDELQRISYDIVFEKGRKTTHEELVKKYKEIFNEIVETLNM
ncbi:hypothetical protein J9303_20355 [Bacillaceae bacterium Marseille-Q3522]|nr:hypothetical protein [Bacillaceae bacterium Marseille-Q3522]